jgi:hypothetical protein
VFCLDGTCWLVCFLCCFREGVYSSKNHKERGMFLWWLSSSPVLLVGCPFSPSSETFILTVPVSWSGVSPLCHVPNFQAGGHQKTGVSCSHCRIPTLSFTLKVGLDLWSVNLGFLEELDRGLPALQVEETSSWEWYCVFSFEWLCFLQFACWNPDLQWEGIWWCRFAWNLGLDEFIGLGLPNAIVPLQEEDWQSTFS